MKSTFKTAALALLAVIAMSAVSCGGGANRKQAADGSAATETKTETKTEQKAGTKAEAPKGAAAVSKYTKPEDYTAGALAKMASLGKTERDRRLVTVGGDDDRTVYTVRTFGNGQCTDKSEYTFYRTAVRDLYEGLKSSATEFNDADKWTRTGYGDDSGTWQSWYDAAKKTEGMGAKILE